MTGDHIEPIVGLVRAWALDWLSVQDIAIPQRAMSADYSLLIGGYTLAPRSEYISATQRQLFRRFPGLVVTAHDVITSGNRVAVAFSEHGADVRAGAAVWAGVALFDWDGRQLTHCHAEEDYFGRRQQLGAGEPSEVLRPAVDPWGARPERPDPRREQVALEWLRAGCPSLPTVSCDGARPGARWTQILEVTDVSVNRMFSAGDGVAFHADLCGRYCGGLPGTAAGQIDVTMAVAGLLTVGPDDALDGFLVRDRLGVARQLVVDAPS